MDLRPYQRDCLHHLLARYRAGRRRVLVSLPTGTGKTVVFASFPAFFRMKKRLLVLAHREELLEQALAKFLAADPALTVDIEQGARRASSRARVVIASVPTLARASTGKSSRLAALDPAEFNLVVVDEAHHAVAPSYRAIFDHFGLFDAKTARMLVGFTATPRRGDRRGLGEVFEEIAYARDLPEMIAAGYLCRVVGWRVRSTVSLQGVRMAHGDFVESQLARAVNVAERNALMVKAYRELASGRRAIVFCVDVVHARTVAAGFAEAGVRAAAVWGAMARDDRRDVLRRFAGGEIDVLTNCNVLTEGFDEPRVACVILGRPTRSRLLYAQMIGRGTRLYEGKRDLAVIDIVDASQQHRLAGLGDLFDLPPDLDLHGADALQTAERLRDVGARFPWIDTSRVASADDLRLVAERVDLFRFDPPDAIAPYTRFTWCASPGDGGYELALPSGPRLAVRPNMLGEWEVLLDDAQGAETRERARLATLPSLADAITDADALVHDRYADAVRVIDREAGWRERAPTERQIEVLRAKRVPIPKGLTRGQASWMIEMLVARGRRRGG